MDVDEKRDVLYCKIMEIKNTFVSTVVIGRFNPSILTPEFLKSQCNIDVGEVDHIKPMDVPVTKEFKAKGKNLSFYADLDRFQINELEVADLSKVVGPEFAGRYLDRLQYTPIFSCGINFNDIMKLRENEIGIVNRFLNNEKGFFKLFETDKFRLESRKDHDIDGSVVNHLWILTFSMKDGLKTSIRLGLVKAENTYEINHNIEVPNLQESRENIKLIIENYENNLIYHNQIMKRFLEGLTNE